MIIATILPTRRRVAKRQLAALAAWAEGLGKNRVFADCDVWIDAKRLHVRATGYMATHDYIGVESAYLEARKLIDQPAKKRTR